MPSRSLMSTQANCSDDNSPPHWFPSMRPRNFFVIKISKMILCYISMPSTLLLGSPPSSHVMNAANELTGSRPRPNKDSALTTAMVIKQTTNNEHISALTQSQIWSVVSTHLCPRLVTRGPALCLELARWQHWSLGRHIQHIVIIAGFIAGLLSPCIFPKTARASLDLSCETQQPFALYLLFVKTFNSRIVTGNGK